MRFRSGLIIGLLGLISILGGSIIVHDASANNFDKKTLRISLVGASIGRGWDLPEWSKRTGQDKIMLAFFGVYDFDKTKAIRKILGEDSKPNYVIIKECSTYFPVIKSSYTKSVEGWVSSLKEKRITPILATVIPPRKYSGLTIGYWKGVIKKLLGKGSTKDEQWASIIEYNEWVKEYASRNGIKVLDLEDAARMNAKERYLDPKYDIGDGVHLNKEGYRALDRKLTEFFREIGVVP